MLNFRSTTVVLAWASGFYCGSVASVAQTTQRVSVSSAGAQSNGESYAPKISVDGRYIAFASAASNLVSGDTNASDDVFVHDRETGETTRVSVSSTGEEAELGCGDPVISSDGRYVAFGCDASNLVLGDTNGARDVFVHDRKTAQTTRVNINSTGQQAENLGSGNPRISSDGRYVAFASRASNLVPKQAFAESVVTSGRGRRGPARTRRCDAGSPGEASPVRRPFSPRCALASWPG